MKRFHKWLRETLRPKFSTVFVKKDLPDFIKPKTLYIVLEDDLAWSAALICPCGCGEVLHLNLLPDERPMWQVTHNDDGTSTLSPSIWRRKGCHSHFWFRHGKIQWTHPLRHTVKKDIRLLLDRKHVSTL